MSAWAGFWAAVLGFSMLALAVLVVWVAGSGVSDIRALFASIEAQHESQDEQRDEAQDG